MSAPRKARGGLSFGHRRKPDPLPNHRRALPWTLGIIAGAFLAVLAGLHVIARIFA